MMSLKKQCEKRQMNNRGSALIMVIVVIAFISIMATTLLYVSGSNFYRKTTDQKTKESFYEAETALEEIRAALTVEVSEAARAAYTSVSINYAAADSATRYSLFQNEFFKKLADSWQEKTQNPYDPTVPIPNVEVVRSLVSDPYKASISLDPNIIDAGTMELHAEEGYAILKGVVLEYTDMQGYTTMITTDYLISIPSINWGVDNAKTDWAPGAGVESLERGTVNMADCVSYYNWVKK